MISERRVHDADIFARGIDFTLETVLGFASRSGKRGITLAVA
ncbi:MAG: hypothetical protein QM756_17035 [Polyangiaceae bacterium]